MKKNKTYTNIIDTARILFMKHGMRRVSIEEICKEASISKMTFYRMFTNKDDVAEKILLEIMEKSMEKYHAIMKQDIPYSEKIKQTIELKRTSTHELSEEFLKDIIQVEDGPLKQHLDAYRKKAQLEYLKDLKVAQKKGLIRKDIKPEFILYVLEDLHFKMTDEKLLSIYKTKEAVVMELTNFFFYGIMPNAD